MARSPSMKLWSNWRGSRRQLLLGKERSCRHGSPPIALPCLMTACLAGRVAWARLTPINGKPKGNGRRTTPLKSTPITLVPRRDARIWASLPLPAGPISASANASKIADFIRENGASFFEEIVEGTHLLRAQVEDGSFGACGVGAGELGQLRGLTRIADAFGRAQAAVTP